MHKTLVLFLLVFLLSAFGDDTDYSTEKNDREFTPAFQKTTRGYLTVIGNQVLCAYDWRHYTCYEPSQYATNNSVYQYYVNTDNEALRSGYFNSSSSKLELKPGDKVIWAGLYWQGRIFTRYPNYNSRVKEAHKVYFKTPTTDGYVVVEALPDKLNWYYDSDDDVWDYAAMAEVTDIVQKSGDYFVANLQTSTGYNLGAGWALAVVVENSNDKLMNINVYDGFKGIYNYHTDVYDESIQVHLTGFYTPRYGDVSGSFILFGNESDRGLEETFTLTKKDGDIVYLHNDANPSDNVLNGTITKNGENVTTREPHYANTLGTDIDEFDIENYLDNGQTETTITLTSEGDRLFFAMFGIALEVYQPNICYLEQLYDAEGNMLQPGDAVRVGDTIKVKVYILNEDNQTAEKVKFIRYFDGNTTIYQNNTTYVQNVGWESARYIADNSSYNDTHVDYIDENKTLQVWYLGKGSDYEFEPYGLSDDNATIEFNATIVNDLNISFNYNVSYIFHIGDATFDYSGKLPQCIEFNNTVSGYRPPLGTFNVTNSNFSGSVDPIDPNSYLNQLYTAIINKDYSVKVLHLKTDKQTLSTADDVVFLEAVDAQNIEDADGCTNAPVVYRLPGTDAVDFGHDNKENSITPLTTKLRRVARNATLRIRYIDWPAVMSRVHFPCASDKKVKEGEPGYVGLPKCIKNSSDILKLFPNTPCTSSTTGSPCATGSGGYGSQEPYNHKHGCLQCLTDFHASTVCARDNFAIRPYSFALFNANRYIRAGEDFKITVRAIDESNYTKLSNREYSSISQVIPLKDYNISVTTLDFNITKFLGVPSSCPAVGTTTVRSGAFRDGEVNATLSYSETGVMELYVQEKLGQEFALVDADDTPNATRLMRPALIVFDANDIKKQSLLSIIPYQFSTTASTGTTTGGNWVYMSNEVNTSKKMAAYLKYTIIAQNKAGSTVKNFTKDCFMDDRAEQRGYLDENASTFDINLTLTLRPDHDVNVTLYTTSLTGTKMEFQNRKAELQKDKNTTITEWMDPQYFTNGKGEAYVYFNIERNASKPLNPVQIQIADANTTTSWKHLPGATNVFNGTPVNQTQNFYYGRLHIPNQEIRGNRGDITVYYEIYMDSSANDPAGIKGQASIDDVDWYFNTAHSANEGNVTTATGTLIDGAKVTLAQIKPVTGADQNLTLSYSGNTFPYAKTIEIGTHKWLLFDKFDPNTQKAKGRVEFTNLGVWLGAADRNFSNDSEFAPSINQNKRILW